MKKKNVLLMDNFGIVCPSNHESIQWRTYIGFLNSFENTENFCGDNIGDVYGVLNGTPYIGCFREFESQNAVILDILEWHELAISHYSDSTIPLWNDILVIPSLLGDNLVQLCDYSNYPDDWAMRDNCVYSAYYDGWIRKEERSTTMHGDIFNPDADNESIVYSDYHDEYIDTERDDVFYGYVHGRSHEQYFHMRNGDIIYIDGDVYRDGDAARYHGFVYDNRQDEWVSADDYQNTEYNADYHELRRKFMCDIEDPNVKFTIGFEIEKEDDDAVQVTYRSLYEDTMWIKENDGSLDSDNGYELVTPVYNLYDNKLDEDIRKNPDLQTLINADHSSNCGGHINISSTKYSTEILFEHLSGWFPLFYSIYENRLERNYSQAKKKYRYYDRDKYSAIYIKSNVLEIRIPSAVKNVNNLLWRRDLIRIMCDSIKTVSIKNCEPYDRGASEVEVLQMMMNPKSKLYKHLRKVFSHDRLLDKIDAFIMYSHSYNDKVLPRIIRGNMKDDNLGTTEDLGA